MSDASAPIGMFDSGAGGLAVLAEVRRLLPGEDVVYFADTAYFPYGPRPAAEIRERGEADHARTAGARREADRRRVQHGDERGDRAPARDVRCAVRGDGASAEACGRAHALRQGGDAGDAGDGARAEAGGADRPIRGRGVGADDRGAGAGGAGRGGRDRRRCYARSAAALPGAGARVGRGRACAGLHALRLPAARRSSARRATSWR